MTDTLPYPDLIERFRLMVSRAVPPDATVLVVSRGDDELLSLGGCESWHFPQRTDGVYAGYHPEDSAAAIAHLDDLRDRGGEFLALPATSGWWLEHYVELVDHLASTGRLLVHVDGVGSLFSLFQPGHRRGATRDAGSQAAPATDGDPAVVPGTTRNLVRAIDGGLLEDVQALFDAPYYTEQCGLRFASPDDALSHYLATGYLEGFSPHRLFDPSWYARHNPEVRITGVNPLVHFVERSPEEGQSPGPYFDTQFYCEQWPNRGKGANALAHYVRFALENKSFHPNPLFRDGYYLTTYSDAAARNLTPLEQFLSEGCDSGRFASQIHRNMVQQLDASGPSRLRRGNWKRGTVLLLSRGGGASSADDVADLAPTLSTAYHLDPVVVRTAATGADIDPSVRHLVLDDYRLAADVTRPSAIRLLVRALSRLKPEFALCDDDAFLEALAISGIPTYFFLAEPDAAADQTGLARVFEDAVRVVVPSSRTFRSVGQTLGAHPVNVIRRPSPSGEGASLTDMVDSLVHNLDRDLGLRLQAANAVEETTACRRIVIPCSDWGVSGVNSALEAVGLELSRRGWQVEILFTRSEEHVMASVGDPAKLPTLPYRCLERDRGGLLGLWEALLADVESRAPCIIFTTYDFLGNSVVPALTDRVGAVLWVQADDRDYYEQVYRLGRHCNAVVCVSERIKERIEELNPAIGARSHVIHNASVRSDEIAARHTTNRKQLRLVYTGRLVEYQKRVFDYIDLARELDGAEVPYTLTMIGEFAAHRSAQERFERLAADHLADGRITLTGRLERDEILRQLDEHDVFVLLSDFEGLPLALLEAMARGCVPVVADMESGIPELIDNEVNGLIMVGREYDKWALGLARLWRDRSRLSKLSRRARSTIRSRFTVEQIGGQFDALMRDVGESITSGSYSRPASLNWAEGVGSTGDVFPPPSIHRPAATRVEGL